MTKVFAEGVIVKFNNPNYKEWLNKTFTIINSNPYASNVRCLEDVTSKYVKHSPVTLANEDLEIIEHKKISPQLELFNEL